jgi:hypothetical protein
VTAWTTQTTTSTTWTTNHTSTTTNPPNPPGHHKHEQHNHHNIMQSHSYMHNDHLNLDNLNHLDMKGARDQQQEASNDHLSQMGHRKASHMDHHEQKGDSHSHCGHGTTGASSHLWMPVAVFEFCLQHVFMCFV